MNTRAVMTDHALERPPAVACLDRSRHAVGVLSQALAMADLLDAPLRVVQAIEPPTNTDTRPDPLDCAIRSLESRQALKRLVADVIGPDRAGAITVELLNGRAGAEIRRECRRLDSGLVVVGVRGENGSGPPGGLSGTVREVLEHATGMVLVAPEIVDARPPRCRHILVPLDGSSWSETALPVALRLARTTGAEMTLAQVIADPDPAGVAPPEREDIDLRRRLVERDERVANAHLELLRRSLVDQGATARALTVRGEDARVALSALLARENFDLVVMSASGHGKARLPDQRCGSVVAHLAGRSPVPLLVVQSAASQAARDGDTAPREAIAPPDDALVAIGADW